MIKILNSELQRQAILTQIIEPNRFEELNGENTLTFSTVLDEKASTYINENAVIELNDDYFDIAYYAKNQNEDGTLTVDVEAEHISYRLNNPDFDMEYFASTGTPTAVLTDILLGTGFTVGEVEFTTDITYSAQEKKSRRQLLMEFVDLLGGEVSFSKFSVGILNHRGKTDPQILTTGKNIRVVSKIYNKRETDINGNSLVAYTCEPIQLQDNPLGLGDEALLIQKDLGIQEQMRVVRHGYNPFNLIETELELANFVSGLEDQMYRIATTSVVKEKLYNGCRIGPEDGFVAERSDGKAKTVMNATEGISIYSGETLDRNFFVGLDGRIQAKGLDIDGNSTFNGTIKANQLLIGGENGTISFLDLDNQPFIPDDDYITTITENTITTTNLVAQNLKVESANIQGVLTADQITTRISQVNEVLTLGSGSDYGQLIFKNGVSIKASEDAPDGPWAMEFDANMCRFISTYTTFTKNVHFFGSAWYGDYEIATKNDIPDVPDLTSYATHTWVSNNFSADGHNHGNDYIKSREGENLSIAATDAGIVVRRGSTVLGSIMYA